MKCSQRQRLPPASCHEYIKDVCFDIEFHFTLQLRKGPMCNKCNAVKAQNISVCVGILNPHISICFQRAEWHTHARLPLPPRFPGPDTSHAGPPQWAESRPLQESTLYFRHDCLLPFTTFMSLCSPR